MSLNCARIDLSPKYFYMAKDYWIVVYNYHITERVMMMRVQPTLINVHAMPVPLATNYLKRKPCITLKGLDFWLQKYRDGANYSGVGSFKSLVGVVWSDGEGLGENADATLFVMVVKHMPLHQLRMLWFLGCIIPYWARRWNISTLVFLYVNSFSPKFVLYLIVRIPMFFTEFIHDGIYSLCFRYKTTDLSFQLLLWLFFIWLWVYTYNIPLSICLSGKPTHHSIFPLSINFSNTD